MQHIFSCHFRKMGVFSLPGSLSSQWFKSFRSQDFFYECPRAAFSSRIKTGEDTN